MSSNRFYLVHFGSQGPRWELFDGLAVSECDPPARSVKLPVVALVPDRLLFFFLPKGVIAKGERSQRAAVQLQMTHFLPSGDENGEVATIKAPSGQVVGLLTHAGLADFVEEHRQVLERATMVTSSFLLSWASAAARGINAWTWSSGNGIRALHASGDLHYFSGNDEELSVRVDAADLGDAPPIQNWGETLAGIVQNKVNLRTLNLPLKALGRSSAASPGRRLIIGVCLIGLLFCVGEAGRWIRAMGEADTWQAALRDEYARVLPDPDVADPYGKLLYRLDQLDNGNAEGVDVIGLFDLLSRYAPQDFQVQSVSLGQTGGTIRATAKDAALVEQMVESISGANGFTFTLDNSNADGVKVNVTIGVTW